LRRGLKDLTAALSRENEAGPGGGPRFYVVLGKPPSGGRLIRRDPPRSESANRTPGPQRRTGRANVKRAVATAALFFFPQALRLAIALAIRRPIVISEATDWMPIVSFARLLSGIVSVGL
jgi:hypothetical protein